MKLIKLFLIALVAVGMATCDGKIEKGKGTKGARSSYTKQQIDKNIDALSTKPWSKSDYENILNKQIPNLKKASEKTAATSSLKKTYTDVMVKEANKLLNDGCSAPNAHTTLGAIMAELKNFSNVLNYDNLVARESLHNNAVKAAGQTLGYQSVSSYDATYDKASEQKMMADAKNWLAKSDLKCKATRDKLEKKSQASYYQGRRQNFCEAIVSYYLRSENPAPGERNRANRSIDSASPANAGQYKTRIEQHYKELQQTQK